jgi:hypothetical protein
MYVWYVERAGGDRVQQVDGWTTLDGVIAEMATSSWEDPCNAWTSYVTDDSTGEAVAVALFGPDLELLVAVSDGRQLRFPMPDRYREHAL